MGGNTCAETVSCPRRVQQTRSGSKRLEEEEISSEWCQWRDRTRIPFEDWVSVLGTSEFDGEEIQAEGNGINKNRR